MRKRQFMRMILVLAVAAMVPACAAEPPAGEETGVDAAPGDTEDTPIEAPGAEEAAAEPPVADAPDADPLLDPESAEMNETAPETYQVLFNTSKGDFTVEVRRDWAPRGADRFYNLVRQGFYDNVRFFRVIREPRPFMVQFGISGDPQVSAAWSDAVIPDDPVVESNTRGMISFATAGPNTRTTQVFINYADNSGLDGQGFSPFGRVASGMEVVDQLHAGYGEGAPRGRGPEQGRIEREGTPYLTSSFPDLDYVESARIVE